MKRLSIIFLLISACVFTAKAQRPLINSDRIDGFYALTMDKMLDTLSSQYKVHFVFDREFIHQFDIVEHYFNESVKDALKKMCKDNDLHYWVESDQTIYIIQDPKELARLKKLPRTKQKEVVTIETVNRQTATPQKAVAQPSLTPPVKDKTQQPFSISGRVIDQSTGESLPAARIKVRNLPITATSNIDGYFTLLRVPADTCYLEVSYIGYMPEVFPLNADNIRNKLTIGLFTSGKELNEVVITDKKSQGVLNIDKRQVSVLQVTPAKLEELPNVGEKDIMRSFQLMPGISASNESSSGAYVRGGTPDQNLVLFDGFTVYQVDHLYGFFSAFNSNAVKDVTLYKGGFSAKYGGRLSSVTDIVGKEGDKNEANIGGDLSLLSANIYGEMPVNNKSTLLLAYRHSYQGPLYDKIFSQFNSSGSATTTFARPSGGPPGGGGRGGGPTVTTPSSYFYDLNAKYTYHLDEKNLFSWSLYQGNDNLDNSRKITLPSFISAGGGKIENNDKTVYGNLGSSLKWSRPWNSKLYSNTLLSYSSYHSNRDNSTSISTTNSDGVTTNNNSGTSESNKLKDWSVKSDWEWQATNNHKILFGAFSSGQSTAYNYAQNDTSVLINQNNRAFTGGGYVELESNITDALQIKPSVRSTYYNQTGKIYWEPRFSATYTLTDRLTLKAATGRFYQFVNKVIREDVLGGSQDFWVLANKSSIPVGSANHFTLGVSYETPKYLFSVEGYYKQLGGLTEYSQRETGNRITGVTLEDHFYNGSGYTKGLEFLVQKTHGKYTGWLSYTMGRAINNFAVYGGEFPANQDVEHEFKSINVYHYGRWTFSTTWIFSTGRPYTAPLSSFTINDYSGTSKNFLMVSGKNAERLPNYSRWDAAVTYDLIKVDSRKVGSIGLSLFNIYNRANVWYQNYSLVSNQVITTNVDYLGFTPNITFSLRWK